MFGTFHTRGNQREYMVKLPDGKKVHIWFIGSILEKIFDAYNIPYKIIKK